MLHPRKTPPEDHQNENFPFPYPPVLCVAASLILGACASQSKVAGNQGRPGANGTIPTRDDRHSQEVAGNGVGGGYGPEYRVPTGSNLPQSYNRKGYTTDAQDPSYVYDQNDVRLQSTNSVGDSLRSVPGVSVNGNR